jgi:DNA-binding transcriptional LysR family regulator
LGEAHAEPSGLIRLNVSRIANRLLIEPHMSAFLARYPKLRLETVMNDGFSNIVADGMDAGIRLGESLDEHMVAVPVTPPVEMAIVGSPDYFARYGLPETPGDLLKHNCLAVSFQEVVHSAQTGKAEVVKASVILGGPNEHPQECPFDGVASRGDGARRG